MKQLFFPLWPRSLRTRLILLVLGTVLLAQAATWVVVSHYRNKLMEDVGLEYIVTTIRTLRAALAQVPAEKRADFVRTASQNQWRLWSRMLPAEAKLQRRTWRLDRDANQANDQERDRERPDVATNDVREGLRGLVQQLNRRLPDGTRVALSRGPLPEVFISLATYPANEDAPRLREWLVIPLDHLDPPVFTPLIVAWLAGLGLILIMAAGFSWHIVRPLTQLADAADRLAAGQPQRVRPSGPHETRALGERFNAMLDALSESESVRRTLLAGLPHDLKGPLSRMWLRIEMADDPKLKEGLRNDLQDMQHMVDQFIGFVRGTDPGTYRYTPLPIAEWLTERVASWADAGSPVHIARMSEQPMTVQGDAPALARLLDNLIGNALHHGAPPVEVKLDKLGGEAVLSVADHGPGIDPSRRSEALRPFARLDDARTRSGNVGLGLALAEAIVRAHGGTLTLGQAEPSGLNVEVRLPLEPDETPFTARDAFPDQETTDTPAR